MISTDEMTDLFQVCPVFITPGKIEKDIFKGVNANAFKKPGPDRTDSLYILDRGEEAIPKMLGW